MKVRLLIALLALGGAVQAQQLVDYQEQLESKIVQYWTAFVERDYVAAYEMYPAYVRSEISFLEWGRILGFSGNPQDEPELRLAAIEIEGISRPDHPDFSHMCEVFLRLRIESQDGMLEDVHVSNVWELDEDGNWAPSMPVALGQ